MVTLSGNYEDGIIKFNEGVEAPVNAKKVIVIFLDDVEVKQPYKLVDDVDSNTFLMEEPVAALANPTVTKSTKKLNLIDFNWAKARELTKNVETSFLDDLMKERYGEDWETENLEVNVSKKPELKFSEILGKGIYVVSIPKTHSDYTPSESEKVLDFSKFNFTKARELTKSYKSSFSEAVIEERREYL